MRMAKGRSVQTGSVIVELRGVDKMSEILIDFAQPLLELVDKEKLMLALAMAAWNIAIFPEEDRNAKIDELVTKCLPQDDPQFLEMIKAVIGNLVLSKLKMYPDNERILLGYEFIESGDKRTLNVMSTMHL
jgi:hypothetical protein